MNSRPRSGRFKPSVFSILLPAIGCFLALAFGARAATFTVNSNADVSDATPGDGVCETATGNHVCTLRAAMQEANALAGADTIDLQAGTTYLLSQIDTLGSLMSDFIISDDVTINGAGPDSSIIDGNGNATQQRVFLILQCIDNAYDLTHTSCAKGMVTVSMSGLTIENGLSSGSGGGIEAVGSLALDDCVVTANTAGGLNNFGGGIFSSATLTLIDSVISNNTTQGNNSLGGGIYAQGSVDISNSTISGNSAPGSPGEGGGLLITPALDATVSITQSTFSGNSAVTGGGIYKAGSSFALVNDTISGNLASGSGGGIYNNSGTLGLYNVTVTGNEANSDYTNNDLAGGIDNATGATLDLANTIVSRNKLLLPTTPFPTLQLDECAGVITSLGYDILTDVETVYCTVNGPYSAADPLLGPLQFNGGLTQTHAIAPGSPAVDAGDPSGCTDSLGAPITTDQRGVPRPYGSACDVGAFEYADVIFADGFEP